ncbi:MAG: ribonuclease J [Bacilli bacterium]|nr:ribonuclease J [Bacilli bacterium]
MSKIKIFSLGGLNEIGKNMYVIEIDKDILVIDAGLKYADDQMLGIDYVIPNIEYLKENKKRIKGIFLTHGHFENDGAIQDIAESLSGIPIYGSKFTIALLKKELEMKKVSTKNLVEIPAYKTLNVGHVKVFPVGLSHSIPDNLGYAIYTKDGVIFYASDFVFDAMMRGHYQTDMGKLAYIGKQGVLCLMAESVYANKVGHTSPNHRISSLIRETLSKAEGRIIFNVLSSHLYRIQELFNEVSKTDRKIIIMGKKLQSIVEYATQNNYLFVDSKCIGDLSNINDPDVVIINSNDRERPYSTIYKIVNGYDKFVKLKPRDTVFLATPIYEGREKTFYKLLDDISRLDVEVVTLSKENLSHHASSEDLMMMMDLMKPKYYFPIKGEYRHQVANANLAMQVGIPANHIILKENGFVASFVNGKLNENDFSKIPCGDISIDGDSSDDIGEVVLRDREMLSDNGIIVISATLSKKTKKIIAGPEILTRGFVYVKDSTELIEQIKEICTKVIVENVHDNYVDYGKIKSGIRENLSKYLNGQTGNKPMIISVLQEI